MLKTLSRFFNPLPEKLDFIFNDGGRALAGFKGGAGDCVVRSISIAANLPYLEVYEHLRQENQRYAASRKNRLAKHLNRKGSSPRDGNHRDVFHQYILDLGFKWIPTMKVGTGCQIHLRPKEIPEGIVIVKVSKHLTTVINGVIHDTHDPSHNGTRCVYGYYIKSMN